MAWKTGKPRQCFSVDQVCKELDIDEANLTRLVGDLVGDPKFGELFIGEGDIPVFGKMQIHRLRAILKSEARNKGKECLNV